MVIEAMGGFEVAQERWKVEEEREFMKYPEEYHKVGRE